MPRLLLTGILLLFCCVPLHGQGSDTIQPGEVWRDTAGEPIQAHGGGILKQGHYWYWFGEDRRQGHDAAKRYVSCYRSSDLVHWENRGVVFESVEPEDVKAKWGEGFVLERPKVFRVGKRFVMYFHLDAGPRDKPYMAAEVGVAVSDRVDGTYRFVKHYRPLGEESRDIGQFVDDDGTNYLVFESRPTHGFFIARLSANGLDVTKTAFITGALEGGAIVHYDGLYYALGSHLTGWKPNPNVYATAKNLAGPWSEFANIAPPETNTYDTQSSMLIKVAGLRATTVIYVGDRWEPKTLWDSRYVWMPVDIGDGKMRLPEPKPWSIDVKTGVVK